MGQSLSASLLLASRTGNANGVKQLVDQGVDIHATFEDEKTALHVAAEEGKDEVLSLLISLGGKVTTVDKQKYTPLHSAVFMGHDSSAALLIANGADTNSKDISGMTPLHWAVKTARLNCVELLMSKGADLNAKNLKGESALDLANKIKPRKLRPDIIRALEGVLAGGPLPMVTTTPIIDTERTIRLRHLCVIWGIIKYAHPHLQYKAIDWDTALINTIPLVNQASSAQDYCFAINKLLGAVGDTNTRAVLKSGAQADTKAKSGENKVGSISLAFTEDSYALITLLDCNQFQDFSQARKFVQVFTEARLKAKGIIFDCRCEEYGNVTPIIYLKQMFYEAFRIFITEAFHLSSSRTRLYRGHHLEWNRFDSENYFEGSLTLDGEMLLPPTVPTPTSPTPSRPVPNLSSSSSSSSPSSSSPTPSTPVRPASIPLPTTPAPSTPVRPASIPLPNTPAPATPVRPASIPLPTTPAPSSSVAAPSTPANPRLALTTPLPNSPAPTRDSPVVSSSATSAISPETEEKAIKQETKSELPHQEPAPEMTFIVNKSTPGCLIDLISALQAKGLAFVVFEDSELKSENHKDKTIECGVPTIKINTSDDIDVYIRTADRINPDGTIGFAPDVVVSPSADIIDQLMLKLKTGQFAKTSEQISFSPSRPSASSCYISRPRENEYLVDSLTPEIRLLSLFKFWNVVESFYPYKDNFTEDWSRILSEFIPVFEEVNAPLDYSLAVARLVARLNDTHAYASSPILNDYMGTHVPPVLVQRLEEKTIVTFADNNIVSTDSENPITLSRGDELISIDGLEEQRVRDKLSKIIPASTKQAKSWRIDQLLLAGKPNSTVTIVTKNTEGKEVTYTLTRTAHPSLKPNDDTSAPFRVVDLGIGYIDTVRLNPADLDKALNEVKDQACLIIDVRGFPQYTLQELVLRLTHTPQRIMQIQTPLRIASSFAQSNASMITETITLSPHKNSINYQGKVVVLINEKTASFAEQNLLYLESVCANVCGGVTFVGTPTNGSVGKLTNVKLPGEIYVGLSGVAMKGTNGMTVQGVGLKPHVVVEPTVAGIIAKEDEVYIGAIKYCKSYLQAPVIGQSTGVVLNTSLGSSNDVVPTPAV